MKGETNVREKPFRRCWIRTACMVQEQAALRSFQTRLGVATSFLLFFCGAARTLGRFCKPYAPRRRKTKSRRDWCRRWFYRQATPSGVWKNKTLEGKIERGLLQKPNVTFDRIDDLQPLCDSHNAPQTELLRKGQLGRGFSHDCGSSNDGLVAR